MGLLCPLALLSLALAPKIEPLRQTTLYVASVPEQIHWGSESPRWCGTARHRLIYPQSNNSAVTQPTAKRSSLSGERDSASRGSRRALSLVNVSDLCPAQIHQIKVAQ